MVRGEAAGSVVQRRTGRQRVAIEQRGDPLAEDALPGEAVEDLVAQAGGADRSPGSAAMRAAVSAGGASSANRWTRVAGDLAERRDVGAEDRQPDQPGLKQRDAEALLRAREDQQVGKLVQIVHHRVGRLPGSTVWPALLVQEGDLGADVEAGALGLELVDVVDRADVVRPGRPGHQQPWASAKIAQRRA